MAELKRVLSFPVILLITINSIMGTGIFFLPAFGATKAGPASLLSWVMLSLVSIYISMCFAELVSMFPKAGGVYEFCKQAYGRFPSFIIGWATVVAGNITIAMLVVGAILYLIPFGATTFQAKLIVSLISISFIVVFNFIAYRGMQTSAMMLVVFAFITVETLVILIVPGFLKIGGNLVSGNAGNFIPFFVFPVSMTFVVIFFIAETFFGWETTTFLAEETKDPERVMPKALILGTVIIAVICLLFVTVTVGVIPLGHEGWKAFPSERPLADIAQSIGLGNTGINVIAIMVYLSIIGSVAGWVVAAPRLILALCRDKLFPGHLGAIHERYGTPHKAIVFQTVLTSAIVLLAVGSYFTLLKLLLPIALFLYSAVILSLIVLRIKKPDLPRPYRQPFGIFGPVLLIMFLLSLVVMWVIFEHGALQILLLGISLVLLGIPFYFLIEMYYDPKMIRKVNDMLSSFALLTEGLFLPKHIVKKTMGFLGDVKGNVVLEFGCSVGTLTRDLARMVTPAGLVYATDISFKELTITKRRLRQERLEHVRLLHDEEHATRVHPLIPEIDAVVSIGMLAYVQRIGKVLDELHAKLLPGARVCFVDYDRFFWLIPTVEWLSSDAAIIRLFAQHGFAVSVERKRGLFWEYVFIHGERLAAKGRRKDN